MKWLTLIVLACVAAGPATKPGGDIVDQAKIGMKERDLVRIFKLKPTRRSDGDTHYDLPNGAHAQCFRGEVYYFDIEPKVGMTEREFTHFNQSNRLSQTGRKIAPYCLYRVAFDSETEKVYHNEYHTVTVRKSTGMVSVVADP